MTVAFCSFGNLSIDDLVFVDGTTQWAVPGGNAIYASLGMAVWGERPVVVAPFGPDYPTAGLDQRIDLGHCPQIDRTLRDWGLYEEDGSRQFIFRSTTQDWDLFSPKSADVLAGTVAAHLAPMPWHRHVELVDTLRASGTATLSLDLDDRRLAEVDRAAVARLMARVDLFLPSRQDGRVIFPGRSPDDTVRLLRDMSPDTPLIALKCGAEGVVAHDRGSRDLLVIPAVPVSATDATGAGDTFCGGALVGYRRSGDAREALLHGAVSASLCVETIGVKGLMTSTAETAHTRLEALRQAATTRPF